MAGDLFRQVNERISEIGDEFGLRADALLELLCECSDGACCARIEISAKDYAAVRAIADRHLVAPGHAPDSVVVAEGDGYTIVTDERAAL
jgi:hypothetical protein